MRGRSILFLILAVGAAALAALFARGLIHSQQVAGNKPAAPPPPAVEVLVASHAIPAGTFVKAEDLRWQIWPENGVAKEYLLKSKNPKAAEDFAGAVVKIGINAGEPITEARVAKPGDSGFLAAVLKPGMRAVAVAVTAATGVSGFVLPGDHVDVLVTHTLPGKGKEKRTITVTDTAAQDLRVITVDQSTDDQSDKAIVAKTVTLEATPKQAEVVSLVAQMGKVSLALRSMAIEPAKVASEDGELDKSEKSKSKHTFTVDREVSALLGDTGESDNGPMIQVVRGNKTKLEPVAPAGKQPKQGPIDEKDPFADSTGRSASVSGTTIVGQMP